MKIVILFHSIYGHIYHMAEAIAEGVSKVEGAEPILLQVPETIPEEALDKMGVLKIKKSFSHIPVAKIEDLLTADGIIFGTPARFGMMSGQMRNFLDQTGQLWAKGILIGKVGSVFTSSSTQHGGQESTILSFHTTLLHHGMVIVGLPYSEVRQMTMEEISGGSPYGASTITGQDVKHQPSENELEMARSQGKFVAEIAKKLSS